MLKSTTSGQFPRTTSTFHHLQLLYGVIKARREKARVLHFKINKRNNEKYSVLVKKGRRNIKEVLRKYCDLSVYSGVLEHPLIANTW